MFGSFRQVHSELGQAGLLEDTESVSICLRLAYTLRQVRVCVFRYIFCNRIVDWCSKSASLWLRAPRIAACLLLIVALHPRGHV